MSVIVALRCKKHNRDQGLPFHLIQIVRDPQGRRVLRHLTQSQKELVKGPWEQKAPALAIGLYCVHCLNEGHRKPLAIDREDWPDLGIDDPPVVFQSPETFQVEAVVEALRTAYPSQVRYVQILPAKPAKFAKPQSFHLLNSDLVRVLRERILPPGGKLYQFQAKAIDAVLKGHDTVITTPTASGKSLAYALPILSFLLDNPSATAIYLSPLVALTEDQLSFLTRFDESGTNWTVKGERFSIHRFYRQLQIGAHKIGIARYDGSVPNGNRRTIRRKQPQYILTTPDMLHWGMLAGAFDEQQWRRFFQGLKYVVIDEMHTYKGVMGASFSNLLRRLQRVCRVHGTDPQFILASATIVDPETVVEKLIGRKPVVISAEDGGAPMNKRSFVIWDGGGVGDERRSLVTQAKNALLFLLHHRIRTIAFARTINEINDIYRFTRAELKESNKLGIEIRPFMRELRKDEKRQIIDGIRSGRIHAVIATTALSMGIDIGSLSAALIIGFPGSIADLWQQAGRAGRSGEGLIILIADSDPLDQFFVDHPQVLFDISAEPVYTNPDNPYIVKGHLLRAANEWPLEEKELAQFSQTAPEIARTLIQEGFMAYNEKGQLELTEKGKEVEVPFRNISFSVNVYTEDDRQLIVEVDISRAQRALHKYAHYQHIDKYYQVTKYHVDMERQYGEILVQEVEFPEYTTNAKVEHDVQVLDQRLYEKISEKSSWHFGIVHVRTEVVGYFKIPLFARSEKPQFQPLGRAAPAPLEYSTQSYWMTFQNSILQQFPQEEWAAGLYSLGEAIKLATAIEELCDPSDIDAVTYVSHPDTNAPTILVYDAIPGGVGITEAAYRKPVDILKRALLIFEECPYCSVHPESRGCPHCVTARYGDESTINRHVAMGIARELLSQFTPS